MSICYVNVYTGNDANDGSSWAQAKLSIPDSGFDEVRIAKTPEPTSLGIDATFTYGSDIIELASPLTELIDEAVGNTWTGAGTGVTMGTNTNRKYGTSSQQVSITSSFSTGKIAYKALASTKDLSGYTRLSFWFNSSNYTNHNIRGFRIALCSDANGDTIVNSYPINDAISSNSIHLFEVYEAGGFGSTINSIALYVDNTHTSTVAIRINMIIAGNDLSLKSLIGKSNSGVNKFYGIRAIVGTDVYIDDGTSNNASNNGYSDETETTTAYVVMPATYAYKGGSNNEISVPNATVMDILGGWNTGTDEQDGLTWVDGICVSRTFITIGLSTECKFERFGAVRYNRMISHQGLGSMNYLYFTALRITLSGISVTIGTSSDINSEWYGYNNYGSSSGTYIFSVSRLDAGYFNIEASANNPIGSTAGIFNVTSGFLYFKNLRLINNNSRALTITYSEDSTTTRMNNIIEDSTIIDNGVYISVVHGYITFINCELNNVGMFGGGELRNCSYSDMFGNSIAILNTITGEQKYLKNTSEIWTWQTVEKRGADPGAWHITFSSFGIIRYNSQAVLIGEIAVEEGVEITIRVWIKANTVSNEQRLIIRKVFNPVEDDMEQVFDSTSWKEYAFTFIPTYTGVVRIELQSEVGGVYVGSLNITI